MGGSDEHYGDRPDTELAVPGRPLYDSEQDVFGDESNAQVSCNVITVCVTC